ncbi:MAG: CAP domain-containing protein [Lachnospiraceae bacterium]|nr:CAP domain-containing protein [Lachnospiraceae bacterium]
MKKQRMKLLSAVLALLVMLGFSPAFVQTVSAGEVSGEEVQDSAAASSELVEITVSGTAYYDYANEVFTLVNEERNKEDLPSLTMNGTLTKYALQRAAECCLYFEHTRPDGESWNTVIDETEYPHTYTGENLALGYAYPESVMTGWMNSELHRENILNAGFTQIGIACIECNGMYFWAQTFGNSTANSTENTYTGTEEVRISVLTCMTFLDYGTITISGSDVTIPVLTITDSDGAVFDQIPILTITDTNGTVNMIVEETKDIAVESMIVPYVKEEIVDETTGEVICRASWSSEGFITLNAVSAGTGYLDLGLYEGDPSPVRVLVSVSDSTTSEFVNITVPGTMNYDYANEVFALVNEARINEGLSALTMNATLTEYALQRVIECAVYYGDVRPNGESWLAVIDEDAYPNTYAAESLAYNPENSSYIGTTPDTVVDGWMESVADRANIFDAGFTQIGIACFVNNGNYYWTLIFGNSTTNTAESTCTGTEEVRITIPTYTDCLDIFLGNNDNTSGYEDDIINIAVGKTTEPGFYLTNTNLGIAQDTKRLVIAPYVDTDEIVDETTGQAICSVSASTSGERLTRVTLTAIAEGTGYLELSAYEGDPSPVRWTIVVS